MSGFFIFNVNDIATVLFLVLLEGLLSLDNALVLAMMTRSLAPELQRRALTYGIWGAFIFRFISLFFLTYLMTMNWVKVLGGLYLLYVAFRGNTDTPIKTGAFSFWRTVLMVEMMDVAFSVDSILAAVSVSQNYFVIMAGGVLGIIMMRFAAKAFIHLLNRWPRFERTAFFLVATIGTKLLIQGVDIPGIDFHNSHNMASWLFWAAMVSSIVYGFKGDRKYASVS